MSNLVTFPGLGLSFEVSRVAFRIGGMNIYWYGVLIALGIVLAILFGFRHCAEFGIDGDAMTDVVVIGVVMGILSARAYYVAMSPYGYDSVWEMLDIREAALPSTAASSGRQSLGPWPASGARSGWPPCWT